MTQLKSNGLFWTWVVPCSQTRADTAILAALEKGEGHSLTTPPSISRSQLKNLFESGQITLEGVSIRSNLKLKAGSEIRVEFPPPKPTELIPEDRPIEILYEDEHLVIVNKPPGLTVHPSTTQTEGTLVHLLLHHIKDLSGIGGVLRPGIVHRIDKNTSGALVITKTDAAHLKLSEVFSRHEIERTYWAICYGAPPYSTQPTRIESLIGRSPQDRKKMSMTVKEGRNAITYYVQNLAFALPEKKAFASWLSVTLETGRTHQIRVHLTGKGFPILGDPTYGTPTSQNHKWVALPQDVRQLVAELPGQALHARVLGFEHPITGKKVRVEAEPPVGFAQLLEVCKKYA